jgi:hypothetical protein
MSTKTKVTLQDLSISNFDQLLDVDHIKGGVDCRWRTTRYLMIFGIVIYHDMVFKCE